MVLDYEFLTAPFALSPSQPCCVGQHAVRGLFATVWAIKPHQDSALCRHGECISLRAYGSMHQAAGDIPNPLRKKAVCS